MLPSVVEEGRCWLLIRRTIRLKGIPFIVVVVAISSSISNRSISDSDDCFIILHVVDLASTILLTSNTV
jgi:hypothetical protein